MTNLYTGDISDDDADVIDKLVQQNASPPTPEEMPQQPGIHVPIQDRPARPKRLITGTITLAAAAGTVPVQILWQDLHRCGLLLFVYSATATDSITVSDDVTKTGGSGTTQQSASISPAHDPVKLDDYTGPLYVAAETGTVKVSWIAITS